MSAWIYSNECLRTFVFSWSKRYHNLRSPSPSDLREQRVRTRRFYKSGEWKEERLRTVWRPGNHLKKTNKYRKMENEVAPKLQFGLKRPETEFATFGSVEVLKIGSFSTGFDLLRSVWCLCPPPVFSASSSLIFFLTANLQFNPKKMNLTLVIVHIFQLHSVCCHFLLHSLWFFCSFPDAKWWF